MKKYILLTIVFILIVSKFTTAQERKIDRTWLNPGIKLGYTFGEAGRFTWGFEISLTFEQSIWGGSNFYGLVSDVDFCKERTKLHLGGQFTTSLMTAGLSAGPTLISEDGLKDVGFTVTPFVGVILYPYFSHTFRLNNPDLSETGVYAKIPLRIQGRDPLRF